MSNRALTWVFGIRDGGVRPGARHVLTVLADLADEENSCFPSVRYVSDVTGMGNSTVRRHLDELTESGYVSHRERRMGTAGQLSTYRYTLAVQPPPKSSSAQIEQCSDRAEPPPKLGGTHRPNRADSNPHSYPPTTPPLSTALIEAAAGPPTSFERVWSAWPRKVGKGAAEAAYSNALKKHPHAAQKIADGVTAHGARYATFPDEQRTFIPHLATWLNQRRWEDEDLPAPQPVKETKTDRLQRTRDIGRRLAAVQRGIES